MVAVRVEPPEVAPGGRVRVESLLYAPSGLLHVAILVCTADPMGVSESCAADAMAGGAALEPCVAGALQPVCVAQGGGDAPTLVEVPGAFEPVIPDAAGVPVESILWVELVASPDPDPLAACADAVATVRPDKRCLLARKRVRVSHRPAPNRNPCIASLALDGAALDASAVAEISEPASGPQDMAVALEVTLDAASVDDAVNAVGEGDETFLDVLWYADCGTLDPDAGRIRCDPAPEVGDPPSCETQVATWKPSRSGACTVFAVVYDGRGGVGWWRQEIQIRP